MGRAAAIPGGQGWRAKKEDENNTRLSGLSAVILLGTLSSGSSQPCHHWSWVQGKKTAREQESGPGRGDSQSMSRHGASSYKLSCPTIVLCHPAATDVIRHRISILIGRRKKKTGEVSIVKDVGKDFVQKMPGKTSLIPICTPPASRS